MWHWFIFKQCGNFYIWPEERIKAIVCCSGKKNQSLVWWPPHIQFSCWKPSVYRLSCCVSLCSGLDKNYCRNPGGERKQPWCYVGSSGVTEVCDINACSATDLATAENNLNLPLVIAAPPSPTQGSLVSAAVLVLSILLAVVTIALSVVLIICLRRRRKGKHISNYKPSSEQVEMSTFDGQGWPSRVSVQRAQQTTSSFPDEFRHSQEVHVLAASTNDTSRAMSRPPSRVVFPFTIGQHLEQPRTTWEHNTYTRDLLHLQRYMPGRIGADGCYKHSEMTPCTLHGIHGANSVLHPLLQDMAWYHSPENTLDGCEELPISIEYMICNHQTSLFAYLPICQSSAIRHGDNSL